MLPCLTLQKVFETGGPLHCRKLKLELIWILFFQRKLYFMLPQSWFQQLCMLLWKLSIANELNIFLQSEKCPNTNIEFFLAHIFLYSDQKKLRSWTFFTQCLFHVFILPIVENDRSAVALLALITSNSLITFIMDGISSKSLRKKCPYSE